MVRIPIVRSFVRIIVDDVRLGGGRVVVVVVEGSGVVRGNKM